MLKKILIGLAALVLLVVLGLAALVALVDVDHFKPRIEQAAQDRLHRTLKFDGKLSLSVIPTIALALPRTTLSERGSNEPFLSLDRARVSVALVPLLSGRLQVGRVSLYGLRATVVQNADGTTNVSDLVGGPKSKPASAEPGSGGGAEPAPRFAQFEVASIEVVDAEVVYRGPHDRDTVTLSRLNLKTGHVAARGSTPIEFSASLAATEAAAAVDLSLKTTADIDLAGRAFAARDLDARASGHLASNRFDVAVTAPRLSAGGQHAPDERVKVVASIAGSDRARAELALLDIAGGADKLSIGRIEGELDWDSPALPRKVLKVKLDGSCSADWHAHDIQARLAAHFDETNASTRVDVNGSSPPRIGFDAEVDRLNLDNYLPASAPDGASAGKPGSAPGVAANAAKAGVDPKIDLAALKSLNLSGQVRIGALQIHKLKADKVRVALKASGGRLDIAPMSAKLYRGALSGSAGVDANTNRIWADVALNEIAIEPLVKDLTGKDLIEGHGGVKLDVTTAGATVGAMRRALGGSASLGLHDGAIRGINIVQRLRDLKTALSGGAAQSEAADDTQKTDFSELTATFLIKNGVASNNDFQASSPALRVTGAGTIDIGAGALDYTLRAAVTGGPGSGDLAKLRGVTVPVHLSGPFAGLSYRLDWSSVARQGLATKAGQQLKALLGNKLKPGASPSDPNPADALKGLLGQ